jgi:hypothetical protein
MFVNFLRELDLSDGLKLAKEKLCRPYSGRDSVLPSKTLLRALLRKMGIEAPKDCTKAELVTMYVSGKPLPVIAQEEVPLNDEELKIVFFNYCQIGNPTNTRLLKSSLFVKLMRDCGLLEGETLRIPGSH